MNLKSIIRLLKSKIQKNINPDKSICSCNSFYFNYLVLIISFFVVYRPEKYSRYRGCDKCTVMFDKYMHVEIEVDNQPNIWVCSRRAIQRKQISRHLILFHNDSREIYDRRQEIKKKKKKSIYKLFSDLFIY